MLTPLIFILFGGFASHIVGAGTLYSQCYDQNKNLIMEKCSHPDIQKKFGRKE